MPEQLELQNELSATRMEALSLYRELDRYRRAEIEMLQEQLAEYETGNETESQQEEGESG